MYVYKKTGLERAWFTAGLVYRPISFESRMISVLILAVIAFFL